MILQPCGTPAAHKRHQLRGETPCDPCRLAYNAWMRQYKAARQAEAKALAEQLAQEAP